MDLHPLGRGGDAGGDETVTAGQLHQAQPASAGPGQAVQHAQGRDSDARLPRHVEPTIDFVKEIAVDVQKPGKVFCIATEMPMTARRSEAARS